MVGKITAEGTDQKPVQENSHYMDNRPEEKYLNIITDIIFHPYIELTTLRLECGYFVHSATPTCMRMRMRMRTPFCLPKIS